MPCLSLLGSPGAGEELAPGAVAKRDTGAGGHISPNCAGGF